MGSQYSGRCPPPAGTSPDEETDEKGEKKA